MKPCDILEEGGIYYYIRYYSPNHIQSGFDFEIVKFKVSNMPVWGNAYKPLYGYTLNAYYSFENYFQYDSKEWAIYMGSDYPKYCEEDKNLICLGLGMFISKDKLSIQRSLRHAIKHEKDWDGKLKKYYKEALYHLKKF